MDELQNTTYADDIDLLINLISQMSDCMSREDVDGISTQLPDPTCHCKYWSEIGVWELVRKLEKKYEKSPRLEIPEKYMTSF